MHDDLQSGEYGGLLRRSAMALGACLVAVVVCYYFVDRPVAFFVHRHGTNHVALYKWLTDPPPLVQAWSPLVLVLAAMRRAWGPLARWQIVLVTACLSLLVADQFRQSLGNLCGRYWPETWFGNPSLIGTDTYGFHPFAAGDDVGSFPSGHAARIAGFVTAWWIAYPRSRPLLILISVPLLASLVLMNYHFVGDIIAGSTLGAIVGAYAATIAGLRPTTDQ